MPWVVEVSQKESLYSIIAVIEGTLARSFPCGSEISFHGWGSRIEHTDCICVSGPLAPKYFLQIIREALKSCHISSLGDDIQPDEPFDEYLPGQRWLNHIGPIEAVHAVGSKDALLQVLFYWPVVLLLAFRDLDVEVVVVLYGGVDYV